MSQVGAPTALGRFMKTESRSRAWVRAIRFMLPLVALGGLWELLAALGFINSVLLPRPSEVLGELYVLATSGSVGQTSAPVGHSLLLSHILVSLYRLGVGFGLAGVIAVPLGIAMGANRYVRRYFDPLISVLMPVPGIAWAPIFMLWLGFGDPTIITVGAVAAFFPIVYNTAAGVRSVDQELVWACRSMGGSGRDVFVKVLAPWAAAFVFTGLKLGLARGWRTVIAVEMIAGSIWGLGFMIFDAREFLQTRAIYGGIIVVAVVFFVLEHTVIRFVESRTVERWGMVRESGTR